MVKHPLFGIIVALIATEVIEEDDEIFTITASRTVLNGIKKLTRQCKKP